MILPGSLTRWLPHALIVPLLAGCGDTPSTKTKPVEGTKSVDAAGVEKVPSAKSTGSMKDNDGDHAHKPSAHGGSLISIGADNYHAEAVFEKGGNLKLFTFGKDEATVVELDSQDIQAFAREKGSSEAEPFVLKPTPQPGDAQGKTSLFSGPLPKSLAGKPVDITIPSLRIGKERFRLSFASAEPSNTMPHPAPAKLVNDEEKKLYLTPGGKYTEADIKANGSVTASLKFAGIPSMHDNHPKPGEKICPISKTKANPKFSWTIDGQVYEFCCPPCVDEFVGMAKEKPAELKPAGEYRQK